MIRYLLGLALPYVGLVAWEAHIRGNAFLNGWFWRSLAGPGMVYTTAILTACLISLLVNYRRPRRMFTRSRHASFRPVFAGAVISTLTILIAIPVVVYGSEYAPDWSLLSGSTLLPTLAVLILCRRAVPGTCRDCGFDLRASLDAGRCPECGRVFA